MPLTRGDLSAGLLLPGIKAVFFETYNAYISGQPWADLVMEIDSNKDLETYAWLGAVPKMKEWLGERTVESLNQSKFTITNKLYESTLSIDRTAIEDDLYGQIRIKIQGLAYEAARHTEQMVFDIIKAGNTAGSTCYDGQLFFDTDHSNAGAEYTTNQSNTGTTALSTAAVQAAIIVMRKVKDDKGLPMGINPTHMAVPVDLEWTAMEILESTYWPDTTGTSAYQKLPNNVLKGRLKLIVSPYLTDTTDWFLFDCSRPIKPIVLQKRTGVEFTALEGQSEAGFMRDQFLYGVRERKAVGYGLWQLAFGSIVSGA